MLRNTADRNAYHLKKHKHKLKRRESLWEQSSNKRVGIKSTNVCCRKIFFAFL